MANRVFLEPACPGHEPRTMRVFGRRHQPLSEIRSRDDATLARSGAGITEPLRNTGGLSFAIVLAIAPVRAFS